MATFAFFVFIGFALSWYFRSWKFFNRSLGYGVIFAAIPFGLKFASMAGLNPIGVFLINQKNSSNQLPANVEFIENVAKDEFYYSAYGNKVYF